MAGPELADVLATTETTWSAEITTQAAASRRSTASPRVDTGLAATPEGGS